jgi:hypothetical protein
MKKQLLTILAAFASFVAFAQVSDEVSIGAGYTDQKWYSLENDEQGTQPTNNWDIAFNLKDLSSCVMINDAIGTKLWNYPKGTIVDWNNVDISDISNWPERYNDWRSWSTGAMGAYADPSNGGFDLDWGKYDLTTHIVTGDSIYIIQLAGGAYKKLWIVQLTGGIFTFKYADIDGTNEITATISKADYTNKNYGYYSIQNGSTLDREPAADAWDLTFVRYIEQLPQMPYVVTGVLSNRKVEVSEAQGVSDVPAYNNWFGAMFEMTPNLIGHDWKVFDLSNNVYEALEDRVYFVRPENGAMWKLVFTGFDMTNGTYKFNKQKLATAGVNDAADNNTVMSLYPNPATTGQVTVVYTLHNNTRNAMLNVYDISGKLILQNTLEASTGMHQYIIPSGRLSAGMYLVTIDTDNGRMQQKLIVQ